MWLEEKGLGDAETESMRYVDVAVLPIGVAYALCLYGRPCVSITCVLFKVFGCNTDGFFEPHLWVQIDRWRSLRKLADVAQSGLA